MDANIKSLGLDILQTVFLEMEQITEEQLERHAEMSLSPSKPGDQELGYLGNMDARKIHLIIIRYAGKSLQSVASSQLSETKVGSEQFKVEAMRYKSIEIALRALFWAECAGSVGYWDNNIGIRSGWIVVKTSDHLHSRLEMDR